MSGQYYDGNDTLIADSYQLDAFGRIRVSEPDLLESLHFSNSAHTLLINTAITGSSTIASNTASSSLRLTNTTSSSDSAIAQTKRYFRYNPGKSYIITMSGNIGSPKANVRQRWGYFDADNGLFFAQTNSGISVNTRTNASGSPVDTSIAQASWNLDKLDGTGISGVILDPSKHNLYIIDFVWHGAGRIRFGILYNGVPVYCHQINTANISTVPFMRTPSLPLRVELVNTGIAASSTTLDLVCFAYQKEGQDDLTAPYAFTASRGATTESVGSTIEPILSIRPKATFNSLTNRIPIIPTSLQVAADQNLIYVVVYLNATLTGPVWTSAATESAVEFDINATAVTGGTKVGEFYVAADSTFLSTVSKVVSTSLQLITLGLNITGSTQDVLTVAARSTAGGTNTWAQITWEEFQ